MPSLPSLPSFSSLRGRHRIAFALKLLAITALAGVAARGVGQTLALVAVERGRSALAGGGQEHPQRVDEAMARDFAALDRADIFGLHKEPVSTTPVAVDAGSCAAAPPTALPLDLVATVVSLSSATASIGERSGDADIYAVGDAVPSERPIATLVGIDVDGVCLWNPETQHNESLALAAQMSPASLKPKSVWAPSSSSASSPSPSILRSLGGNKFEVSRDDLDRVLGNLVGMAGDVRFFPTPGGFKAGFVKPGSVLSVALERGDVITRVNGYGLGSLNSALEVAGKLRDQSHFSVDVIRKGAPVTLDLDVAP